MHRLTVRTQTRAVSSKAYNRSGQTDVTQDHPNKKSHKSELPPPFWTKVGLRTCWGAQTAQKGSLPHTSPRSTAGGRLSRPASRRHCAELSDTPVLSGARHEACPVQCLQGALRDGRFCHADAFSFFFLAFSTGGSEILKAVLE